MTPERVLQLLDEALAHCQGTHTLEDVRQGIAKGALQLWIGERSVAVTELVNYPQRRVLNVFLAAGEHDDMAACMPGVEAFARGVGASALMMAGRVARRTGWDRLFGFETVWTGHWKELT